MRSAIQGDAESFKINNKAGGKDMKDRILDGLSSICYYLGGISMFLLCIIMLIEVAFRYIPGVTQAQPWIPGVLSLLDIWLIFLASVFAMRKDSHLRITFFVNLVPHILREWTNLIVNCVTLFVFLVMIIFSQEIVKTGMDMHVGGVPFSKGYSFISLPICIGLMSLFVLIRIVDSITKMRRGGQNV
jgi:TRAP-type C4-dicarboxylate transport system permease small subunit